jgi:hypothetical protein
MTQVCQCCTNPKRLQIDREIVDKAQDIDDPKGSGHR